MSHFISTTLAPVEGCDLVAVMGGTLDDIPLVRMGFDARWHDSPTVEIALGNSEDPAAWLRTAAARMVELAEQIEALGAGVSA